MWIAFGEIFDDRERIPYDDISVVQRWTFAGWRKAQYLRAGIFLRQGDHDFVEGDAEMAHQNPWPERPGRIGFVGDDENGLHSRGRQFLRNLVGVARALPAAPVNQARNARPFGHRHACE
jgi:hypothetical protein